MKHTFSDLFKAALLASAATSVGTLLTSSAAIAQELPECRSTDPADIPAASKPYFMLIVDTSGSMNNCTNPENDSTWGNVSCPSTAPRNSCNMEPTRTNDAKCALRQTVQAFAGMVNFGLATYPRTLSACPANAANGGACIDSCTAADGSCPGGASVTGAEDWGCTLTNFTNATGADPSCGNRPDCSGTNFAIFQDDWFNGGKVVVPLLQDPTWGPSAPTTNVPELLSWFDGICSDNKELWGQGYTPIEGSLRTAHQYLAAGWLSTWANGNYCPASVPNFPTPISSANDRTCRSLNIILVTDGAESCNGDPVDAAADLYNTGVTIQGQAISVKTHVIALAVDATAVDDIADAGDDGNSSNNSALSLPASNETELAQALATIIGGSVSPEVCDNDDNNCNGCTDELYQVYCNRGRTPAPLATLQVSGNDSMCCSFTNDTQRLACLNAHAATISGGNPTGNRWLLPCWDPANTGTYGSDPTARWLCTDPDEICDNGDNNCELSFASLGTNVSDEGQTKCGNPAHCPLSESCDNEDDDCDGIIDNAQNSGTPYSLPGCLQCIVSQEICDGCDNDNDGSADGFNGNCALAPTAECFGTRTCPAIAVPACTCNAGGNSFTACDVGRLVQPDDDTCDQFDDDCDGVRDEDAPPTPCGNPAYYYGPESHCAQGQQACNSAACVGAVGPSIELCNGQDDNCDGFVDGTRPGGVLIPCDPLDANGCTGLGANSACIEDLVEGFGDSYCVIPSAGTGGACGTDNGLCSKGTIQCIGGALVCAGGTQPQPENCNAIDDDCDNQIDEGTLVDSPGTPGCWNVAGNTCNHEEHSWNYPPGASCDGLGTLLSPCAIGQLTCSSGAWICVGPKPPAPEVCDGQDNNCDGNADDGNPGGGATCGTDVGDCTSGILNCSAGQLVCSGTGPFTEVCDGDDNDCDGVGDDTDPDVLGIGEICGVDTGVCQSGTMACIGSALVCQGQVTASPEVCNGLDDNCNGQIDEAPTDAPANLGCWDFTTGTGACNGGGLSWDPPPGGTCTGLGTLTVPCAPGILVCTGLSGWECQGGTLPQTEACDGLDNDCAGGPDNGDPGGGAPCGATDVGECSFGQVHCVGGSLTCQGEVVPTTEICDDLDNDCDNVIDDGVTTGVGNPCGTATGACDRGATACVGGTIQCVGGVSPAPEVCNDTDDDCDGLIDESPTDAPADPGCWDTSPADPLNPVCSFGGVDWDPPTPGATCTTPGSLSSPCTAGTLVCIAGAWGCQGALPPSPESCDDSDNDCDGLTDNGNPGGGASCSSDVGACSPGTLQCTGGSLVCFGGTSPTAEICNGQDDDCDGFLDGTVPPARVSCNPANGDAGCASQGVFSRCLEDQLALGSFYCARPPAGFGGVCGTDVGACVRGVSACVNGSGVCLGEVTPSSEVCNGIDDDCDGAIDDTVTDAPADPGCWNVPPAGAPPMCTFGSLVWDHPPGATCTGLGTLSSPCFAGTLVCNGSSGWVCQGGLVPALEVCDGSDNDCDAAIDDGDPGGGTSCGTTDVGECALGTEHCVGGSVICQGGAGPTTEICDGLDNDCDGSFDEGLTTGIGNPCGISTGACDRGVTACVAGTIQCTGGINPVPEVCNAIDDDCDGLIDESPTDAPSDPGCWDNPPADPANPQCTFATLDWDPPTPVATCTTTGTLPSPCSAGTIVCINGAWGCQGPLPPSPEVCDAVDNNCDGSTDEGNPGGGANCSSDVGACSPGTMQCTGGNLTCAGGTSPTTEVCNGTDDDCDGFLDGTVSPARVACDPANGDTDCAGQGVFSRCLEDQVDLGTFYCARPPAGFGGVCGTDVGACVRGLSACVAGAPVCLGQVTPIPETCNGIDDDCDGAIDDTVTDAPADPGCWNVPPAGNPAMCTFGSLAWDHPPGATCTDLGILSSPCFAGTLVCNGSSGWVCQGGLVPALEVCDGSDNDCDAAIDDGDPGGGTSCGTTDVGECALGTEHCVGGSVICQGGAGPTTEICDGLDNDCDGSFDEGLTTGIGNPCGLSTGACDRGVTACVAGTIQCTGGINPIPEVCNAIDDDCDGLIDESPTDAPSDPGCWDNPPADPANPQCTFATLDWDPPTPTATCTTTGTLPSPCTAGTIVCINGAWGCQGPLPPSPEVCDAVDNNCDGSTDEGNPGGGANCSSDVGACSPGTMQCTGGNLTCAGGTSPTTEVCNGTDDDCDGFLDGTVSPARVACDPANGDTDCAGQGVFSRCLEDQVDLGSFYCARPPAGFGGVCGTDVGACVRGLSACVAGAPVCLGQVTPIPETCNGIDDDCDGAIDDAPTDAPSNPGCWNVAGNACTFGSLQWSPPPGATCNGLGTLSAPCFTGALACDGLAGWVCQGGRLPAVELCDGVDNNCNSATDENNPGGGATCGNPAVGTCLPGSMTCVAGQLTCVGEVGPKPELCNNLDDDCDTQVDEGAPGADRPCGDDTGTCTQGLTACVSGSLICQGGVGPGTESCNGLDDDCDGVIDDGTLSDAPPNPSCWTVPGGSCSYQEATWDPPAGAGCTGLGGLSFPCATGNLTCVAGAWACQGGKLPVAEVCDGSDNNCDGVADDNNPGGGAACGSDIGECSPGNLTCLTGTLQCTGGTGATTEICDGLDNDCDGTADDGIQIGGPCTMPFDQQAYPGTRSLGLCRLGTNACDVATGQVVCVGGQPPEAELCDGLDNDCDGVPDEMGVAPDGIDGTTDPDSTSPYFGQALGADCGIDVGECDFGELRCPSGRFECIGDETGSREICDCLDNDCDGSTDELAEPGEQSLCSGQDVCANNGGQCACVEECGRGEFVCSNCISGLPVSGYPDDPTVSVCWVDPCGGNCAARTVNRADGQVECAPTGDVPVCVCKGDANCHAPCFGVQCDTANGFECVQTGTHQGTCQETGNCRFFGCPDGEACSNGACVANPCEANPCGADEACKPSADFSATQCLPTCMDVSCTAGESCSAGQCAATGCGGDCPDGEVCLGTACGPSACTPATCADGRYCVPETGACIEDPCAGVICPTGGICSGGECVREDQAAGGTGGTSGAGGTGASGGTGAGGQGAASGSGGAGGAEGGSAGAPGGAAGAGAATNRTTNDVIGLATGGGGCSCDLPNKGSSSPAWLLALVAMGAIATRRGARREGGAR